MGDQAVKDYSSSLQFVTDWFVPKEQIDLWHDDYYYGDDDHWMMIMININF